MVALDQRTDQAYARGVHCLLLEPAVGPARIDDDELGRIGLVEPLGNCLGDPARSEILRFRIEKTLRALDMLDEQRLDLVNLRHVAILRAGAGDPDFDVFEFGDKPVGPGCALLRHAAIERFASCRYPAIAAQFGQGIGDIAFHQHRHIVPGGVEFAIRQLPANILVKMSARIPAVGSHVDPAADREIVIDDDDLLVVAGADRVRGIVLEIDPILERPADQVEHHQPAKQRFDEREIPLEDVDAQARGALCEPDDERSETCGEPRIVILRDLLAPGAKMNPGVEIPPDQEDRLLGLEHGFAD